MSVYFVILSCVAGSGDNARISYQYGFRTPACMHACAQTYSNCAWVVSVIQL